MDQLPSYPTSADIRAAVVRTKGKLAALPPDSRCDPHWKARSQWKTELVELHVWLNRALENETGLDNGFERSKD